MSEAKWTFMVYMAGDNNLAGAGEADMAEMRRVGSSAEVNVVVQFDNAGARGTSRYLVQRNGRDLLQSDRLDDVFWARPGNALLAQCPRGAPPCARAKVLTSAVRSDIFPLLSNAPGGVVHDLQLAAGSGANSCIQYGHRVHIEHQLHRRMRRLTCLQVMDRSRADSV